MKKFVSEVSLYGFGILLVSAILSIVIYGSKLDFYEQYESSNLIQKTQMFSESSKDYNTVFIGSSRVYHHVNTVLFDSITQVTRSFNMGDGGFFPFRSFEYLERFAELNERKLKYAFVELSMLSTIGENYKLARNYYGFTLDKYLRIVDMCRKSRYSKKFKLLYFLEYSRLLLYKYQGFGISKYVESIFTEYKNVEPKNEVALKNRQGFLDLEYLMEGDEERKKRFKAFKKNGSKILIKRAKESRIPAREEKLIVDSYMKYAKKCIDKMRSKGVQVVLFIPPRQSDEHIHYLLNLQKYLSDYPSINEFDASENPEYFEMRYSFDKGHLNEAGARLLTINVANKFLKLEK